jgi:flagellar basal-body rod modification protein FlgD
MASVDSTSYIQSLTDKGTTSTSTSSSTTDAASIQNQFLTLLIAQVNSQDPLNPMDNAEMTSQMAQISTVTGITNLNTTMQNLGTQLTSSQMLEGTSMVGHDVLVNDTTLTIREGTDTDGNTVVYAGGAIDLAGAADSVKVEILNPAGQVIDTINAGAQSAGRHYFNWDASDYNYAGSPTFRVVATQAGNTISATGYARDVVQSVSMSNGTLQIDLQGTDPVAYSDIVSVL